MSKDMQVARGSAEIEPRMWFVVRDSFGHDVGPARYSKFDEAARALRLFCESSRNEVSDVDGAMLGVVYQDGERNFRCVLVENQVNGYFNEFRSMHESIPDRMLDIPEIVWAVVKGKQMESPYDQGIQRYLDAMEEQLRLNERGLDLPEDLYVGKWRVHIVPPCGQYAYNNTTHDRQHSIVEFWDMGANQENFPEGQYVRSFSVEDMLSNRLGSSPERLMGDGLCLDSDNSDTRSLSGAEMRQVFDWLQYRELQVGESYRDVRLGVDMYGYGFDLAKINVVWALEQVPLTRDVACVGLRELPNQRPRVKDQAVPARVRVDVVFQTQADEASVEKEIRKCFGETYKHFGAEPYGVACEMRQVAGPSLDSIISGADGKRAALESNGKSVSKDLEL